MAVEGTYIGKAGIGIVCVGTGILGGVDPRKDTVCYLDRHCGVLLSERYWCHLVTYMVKFYGVFIWCIHMI